MRLTLRSAARLGFGALRWLLDIALMAVVAGLLVRFALQFQHPPKWDALWLIIRLRRWGDPLIVEAGSWLGLAWPASPTILLPLGLAAVVWVVKGVTAYRLERASRRLAEPAPAAPVSSESYARWLTKAVIQDQLEGTQLARDAPAPGPTLAMPARTAVPAPIPSARTPAPAASPPPPRIPQPEGNQDPTLTPRLGETVVQTEASPLSKAPATLAPGVTQIESAQATAGKPRRVERIGRYEVVEELGRGAMGVVYKARDPQIGRTVAIKTVLAANLSDESVEKYKRRFYVEAQAAGKLSHPGIVTIHDLLEDDAGQPCMVMEFVEGATVEKLVEGGRLPLEQCLEIGVQVANALDYAHRRGVIHRDIKPANILITQEKQAKVTDFGIAKLAGMQLTQTGQILGTPAFMSPEQFSGAAMDSRTDLFSLGSVLYWLCTGEKPFPGETVTAISFKVMFTEPLPARHLNPALPAGLDAILSRCLHKNPGDRYPTGRDLATALEAFKTDRSSTPVDATLVDGPEE